MAMGFISRIFFGHFDDECQPDHVWKTVALDKVRFARVMLVSAKTGVKPGTLINVGMEMMLSAYDRGEVDFETKSGDDVKVILKKSTEGLDQG